MNNYIEFKKEEEKEISLLPIYWAFSEEQLKDVFKKLGIKDEKDFKNKCLGYGGGFILKTDKPKIDAVFKRFNDDLKHNLDTDDDFLQDAFEFELSNHEYIITYDLHDTLRALGLIGNDLSERQRKILAKAIDNYKEEMAKMGW